MPDVNRDQGVQLGCGTLIIIALIVMFFSQGDTKKVERDVQALRSEVGGLRKMVEDQTAEIRKLRDELSTPTPKASIEKGKE